MTKIQAEHWPWLKVNDTFKSNEKNSTINKIIKKLGHCPLASLQSLDDKRLPSRVMYVTNQNLGRFYKIKEGNIKRNFMKALDESNVLGFGVFF